VELDLSQEINKKNPTDAKRNFFVMLNFLKV